MQFLVLAESRYVDDIAERQVPIGRHLDAVLARLQLNRAEGCIADKRVVDGHDSLDAGFRHDDEPSGQTPHFDVHRHAGFVAHHECLVDIVITRLAHRDDVLSLAQ